MKKSKLIFAALFSYLASCHAFAATYVYVSNKEDGTISSFELNQKTGKLLPTPKASTPIGLNIGPTVISPDHQYLYAITRDKPYFAQSFKINAKTGDLTAFAKTMIPSSYAYSTLDKTGQYLLSASYDDDLVSIHKVEDGKVLDQPIQTIRTQPNTHAVITDQSNQNVYATSLSGQVIHQYRFDPSNGHAYILKPATVSLDEQMTPRHLIISQSNEYVYVLDEVAAKVITYKRDAKDGHLTQIAVTASMAPDSTLNIGAPRGEWRSANPALKANQDTTKDIWAADIHITPNGKFLYSSERTTSTLTLFHIDTETGIPTRVKSFATEKQPRGFNISPNGRFLISAGEKTGKVSVFKIDQKTGELSLKQRYPVGLNPLWISITDID